MTTILERKLPSPPLGVKEIQERIKEFRDRKWLGKCPGGRELVRDLA